MHMLIIAVS